MIVAVLVLGCGGGEKVKDTAPAADDTGTPGTTDTGPVYVEGQSPTVVEVTLADCGPDPDAVDTWHVAASVADAQDDITSEGSTVTVIEGDTALATYDIACAGEACSGSWQATDDGVGCDISGDTFFRWVVADEAGNLSLPYDYDPP